MIEGADGVAAQARRAAGEAAPWVERLARAGYVARGVVYLVVGWLAARAAWRHGRPGGTDDALDTVHAMPGGRWLLVLLAVGLAGFALWRFVQAALDPEGSGSDAKGAAKRIGHAASGLVHAGLALTAARLAMHWGGGGGASWADTALSGRGRAVILAVALGTAGYGVYQLVRAWRADVGKRLDLSSVSEGTRTWLVRAARMGLGARGVVFVVAGLLVVRAAHRGGGAEPPDLEAALRALQAQPEGAAMLGVVGVGLAAYGIFELVKARYRRIRPA
jgi:hypothetical protein